jgi:double-stranded uracil-DNA glycosylase
MSMTNPGEVTSGVWSTVATAETGRDFGSVSNRFWRALHLAGFTPSLIEAETVVV